MTRVELAQRFEDTGWQLRLGRDAEAMLAFPELLELLQQSFGQGWLDVEASMPVLEELLSAHERGDHLLMADIMELIIARSLRG
ncbi:MAG: hypothetical protein VX944_04850 [Myxococcota bacterium]|nr:hypothetical protein [Myxococcota bacterium]MEC9389383.1 hypothetical protein [Myxococcota bacterium]